MAESLECAHIKSHGVDMKGVWFSKDGETYLVCDTAGGYYNDWSMWILGPFKNDDLKEVKESIGHQEEEKGDVAGRWDELKTTLQQWASGVDLYHFGIQFCKITNVKQVKKWLIEDKFDEYGAEYESILTSFGVDINAEYVSEEDEDLDFAVNTGLADWLTKSVVFKMPTQPDL